MERIEPSNSVKMPAMNFGVYWITDPTECEAAVLSAWRGIDTAASYLNERAVGRAVARSGIPCSELFISTKQMCIRDRNLSMESCPILCLSCRGSSSVPPARSSRSPVRCPYAAGREVRS